MTDRQSTHVPGCWGWGPKHYECAVSQIERLAARLAATQPQEPPSRIARPSVRRNSGRER